MDNVAAKDQEFVSHTIIICAKMGPYEFEKWKWLLQVRSKDREWLQRVFMVVDDESQTASIMATNGHCLLEITVPMIEGFKTGVYKVLAESKNIVLQSIDEPMIDYISLFKMDDTPGFFKIVDIQPYSVKEFVDRNFSSDYTRIIREMPPEITINYKYLLLVSGNGNFTVHIPKDGRSALRFFTQEKRALIMPLVVR